MRDVWRKAMHGARNILKESNPARAGKRAHPLPSSVLPKLKTNQLEFKNTPSPSLLGMCNLSCCLMMGSEFKGATSGFIYPRSAWLKHWYFTTVAESRNGSKT